MTQRRHGRAGPAGSPIGSTPRRITWGPSSPVSMRSAVLEASSVSSGADLREVEQRVDGMKDSVGEIEGQVKDLGEFAGADARSVPRYGSATERAPQSD